MASSVDDDKKSGRGKKVKYSKELLDLQDEPPTGLTTKLLELGGKKTEKQQKKCVTEKPKTFKVKPSSALSRVRNFLPELERADGDLKRLLLDSNEEEKEKLDIENCDEGVPHIQFDLALVPLASDEEDTSSGSASSNNSDSSEGEEEEEWGREDSLPLVIKNKTARNVIVKEVT